MPIIFPAFRYCLHSYHTRFYKKINALFVDVAAGLPIMQCTSFPYRQHVLRAGCIASPLNKVAVAWRRCRSQFITAQVSGLFHGCRTACEVAWSRTKGIWHMCPSAVPSSAQLNKRISKSPEHEAASPVYCRNKRLSTSGQLKHN